MSHLALRNAFDARRQAQDTLRSLYDDMPEDGLTAEMLETEQTLAAEIERQQDIEIEALKVVERQASLDEMYEQAGISRALQLPGTPESPEVKSYRKMREILRSVALGEAPGVQQVNFGGGIDIQRDDVALVAGTATDGAELIETQLDRSLVDYLQESIGAMRAGARVITTTSGNPITIPTVTSHSTVLLEGETDQIARSGPQFSSVSLGAYKYSVIVQISRELLEDSAFPIVPFVIEQAVEEVGRLVGTEFITGSGTGAPQGIDLGTTVVNAAAVNTWTTDELMDVFHGIAGPYRQNGTWIMNDSTVLDIRKKKDSTGQYIWQPGMAAGVPDMLLGKPVVTDAAVMTLATGNETLIFGDLRRAYTIRLVNGMDIARSDEFAFDTDLSTWRFVLRADGVITDNAAVVIGEMA